VALQSSCRACMPHAAKPVTKPTNRVLSHLRSVICHLSDCLPLHNMPHMPHANPQAAGHAHKPQIAMGTWVPWAIPAPSPAAVPPTRWPATTWRSIGGGVGTITWPNGIGDRVRDWARLGHTTGGLPASVALGSNPCVPMTPCFLRRIILWAIHVTPCHSRRASGAPGSTNNGNGTKVLDSTWNSQRMPNANDGNAGRKTIPLVPPGPGVGTGFVPVGERL